MSSDISEEVDVPDVDSVTVVEALASIVVVVVH